MKTTTNAATETTPRTLKISIGTLTFVKKTVSTYSQRVIYLMDLVYDNGISAGRVEVGQWARNPTLFGIDSNGCSFGDVTLEMIDGKLVEVFPISPRPWTGTASYQIAIERSRAARVAT